MVVEPAGTVIDGVEGPMLVSVVPAVSDGCVVAARPEPLWSEVIGSAATLDNIDDSFGASEPRVWSGIDTQA